MRCSLLFLSLLLIATWPAFSQPSEGILQIEVRGALNNKGVILCSVFKEAKGFPDQPSMAIYKGRLPIREGRVLFEIASLPAGLYAVALLHDENEDNKMNTTSFGLPKEGYGFSNNVMGLFGPPSFSKASVSLGAGAKKNIAITLRY
jgi:uncharacterized protein (DUF2141 family)